MRARVLTTTSHDLKNDHGRIKWPYKGTALLEAEGTSVSPRVRIPPSPFAYGTAVEKVKVKLKVTGRSRDLA